MSLQKFALKKQIFANFFSWLFLKKGLTSRCEIRKETFGPCEVILKG